ncbi:MAG TPA: hypothetical protein VKS60_17135 [Stellaceae bacterium]|nr:hypothetical protein [Stellaceae bacterium]
MARIGFAIAAMMVALIASVTALVFLAVTTFLALRQDLSPPMAALATSACALLFAAIVALIGWLVWRGAFRTRASRPAPPGGVAAALGEIVGREYLAMAKAAPGRTVGIALVAGFVVGAVPEVRRALAKLMGMGSEPKP